MGFVELEGVDSDVFEEEFRLFLVLLELQKFNDIGVFHFVEEVGFPEGDFGMSFHDFDGVGFVSLGVLCPIDSAKIPTPYCIFNLIFFHSITYICYSDYMFSNFMIHYSLSSYLSSLSTYIYLSL